MKIKTITIEFELDKDDIPNHATAVIFRDGMWAANGPTYSRVGNMQHTIWQVIKNIVVKQQNHPTVPWE